MGNNDEKMVCPHCGAKMNHHGDKLVYNDMFQAGPKDSGLGGVIEEFHTCPQCGAGGSRHAY
jgi:ribosomal protein S27AE